MLSEVLDVKLICVGADTAIKRNEYLVFKIEIKIRSVNAHYIGRYY